MECYVRARHMVRTAVGITVSNLKQYGLIKGHELNLETESYGQEKADRPGQINI